MAESDLIQFEQVNLLDSDRVQQLFAHHRFDGMFLAVHTHQFAQTRNKNNEIYPITLNYLETARQSGVKRAVFGGSMAAYGGLIPPYNESIRFPPEVMLESEADKDVVSKFEVATKRALEIIVLDYGQDFQMGLSVPAGSQKL